jgi:hypothetical protein
VLASVEPVVIGWISLGIVGLSINLFALGDAILDDRVIKRRSTNGLLRLAAAGNLARELGRVTVQSLLLLLGVLAAFLEPPPPGYDVTTFEHAFRVAMFAVQAFLILGAISDRVIRRRMLNYPDSDVDREG